MKTKRTQIAIAAVCMLIGVLIVTQLRVQQTSSPALQAATESDLGQIASNLDREIHALRAERADLQLQLFKIERASNDSGAVMEESSKNLNKLKVIAGLTKVKGPGIWVRITDADKLLNAYDLIDIVTELRSGGAEAISINNIRVVAKTGITQNDDSVFIGRQSISPPYEVLAIGDPEVLHKALVIPGGARDALCQLPEVSLYINKETDIYINSVVSKNQK